MHICTHAFIHTWTRKLCKVGAASDHLAVTGCLSLAWGRVSTAARELGWMQGQLWLGDVRDYWGNRGTLWISLCMLAHFWYTPTSKHDFIFIFHSWQEQSASFPQIMHLQTLFLEETPRVLSAAKVIEISATSAPNMPCTLYISFIINIRCQLNTVTLKYPTLNSECLTSKPRPGP